MYIMFVDIHAHLDLCKDVDSIVKRANDVFIISNGLGPKSNRKVLKFSEKYSNVGVAFGLYPSEILKLNLKEIEDEIEFIKKEKKKVLAIGEVGLDFLYGEHEKQIHVFKQMIDLSFELNVPLIVHSRKAEEEVIQILEEKKVKKVIMHCFCGNFKLVQKVLENNWMFSVPVIVLRSKHFQNLVETVSLNNLLTETDSPYLGVNGENEPSNVKLSVEKIAHLKKMNKKIVERKIFSNFEKVFNKFSLNAK